MTTTYAALQTETTSDQYLSTILSSLAAQGFPTTAWQPGNAGRSLARADAESLADLRSVVAEIARGGYLDTATGDWLDLVAQGLFDLPRVAATFAVGNVTLTCSAAAGPYTIGPGALVVTDGTRRWRSTNTATLTLTTSGTLSVQVRAETPGTSANISGSLLLSSPLSPALAGVTVSAAVSWITAAAVDAETDAALRARCRLRWSTLGRGANLSAYQYNTLAAGVAGITRVQVLSGPGNGEVTIYVAQASGTATTGQVAAVQSALDVVKPVTDTAIVTAATAVVIAVTATVYVAAASDSTPNRTLATDAISAYVNGLGLGSATVDTARIGASIYAAAGIQDVDLVAPAADVSIAAGQVATVGAVTLTWVTV